MKSQTVRRWSIVHTWSSLICTLFLLMLAVTGLPLIFHHEIDHLLGDAPHYKEMPADTPRLDLEQLARAAEAHRPGEVMQYFGWDDEDPNGVMAITAATAGTEPNSSHTFALDARTGEALEMPSANGGFMMVMLRLHVDMYANLPGKLLLAFMGLLFVVAIVSGTVLYAPFMRKLEFGQVRVNKSRRTRWLDLHNLIGVVTLTWALVVGVTGVISACADLLIASWRNDALATMIAPYKDAPPLTQRAPATRLLEIAESAAPGMQADFIAFPGTRFSSEHHYAVFLKGNTHLTAHLATPVLIDAQTLHVTAVVERPWYMDALGMSQPLHFGDYGGMPMKILWAVLDVLTIIVLGSGVYLWWVRRRAARSVSAVQAQVAQ
ncbi:PepSY-associated TM helix domain-containing protein [Pseudomonas syringae]|uniref:PepSY domain-containing protein n=5 Tax=Pseudomonas TaxID=286 RepID=A0AAJ4E6D1_PSESX|nr:MULTISPECIES: PepSY-associated TM helix domain-containing protein [Pseudomonas]MCW6057367.1 PepSY domain-containing protein [Pseudomonas fragi]AAY39756.1 PepSY-associated TM helix [Pseudomonas syringae pv. syringae B728a]AKF48325.1 putative iron-regulated membrane protein [Pseudomonas syringae pv. syringae B301D]EXL29130.1 putative iron-regulated membrane protein [Pseudomonas syringae pv. syringae str. B301D-R]KPY63735.1 PepSY-associated TM helix [Pseudomonas syringae pv. solidagae]